MMVQRFRLRNLARRFAAPMIAISALIVAGPVAPAQEYTCFPTCSTTDGRFLALAGAGLNTFAGDEIRVGIGMPGTSTRVEIGIYDGETGGLWDVGTVPLRYRLYADPNGDGTNAVLLGEWLGTSMTDTSWYTISMDNAASARSSVTGNYVYYLHVESTDTIVSSTSSFKLRTTGTITIRSHQAFSIYSPVTKAADAAIIYPNYPTNQENSTYDGTWNIFIDVPTPSSKFSIWDGDMDHGSFDGSTMDTDDPNTDTTRPDWSTPAVRSEGVAFSAYTVRDPVNTTRTDLMSGDPADDNANVWYRRTSPIYYQVVDPNNVVYQNLNPSGNLEWENFVIDTAAYDATINDVHASSLPAGIYKIRLIGMDMGNVNAWRFFNEVIGTGPNNEVLGVNIAGNPVIPIRAIETIDGSISGVLYYDADSNGTRAATESGIPSVSVILTRFNPDGTVNSIDTVVTDANGAYSFESLGAASYTVTVDATTLQEDVIPMADPDGITTVNTAAVTLDGNTTDYTTAEFGYKRLAPTVATTTVSLLVATGTRTRGFWVNHKELWDDIGTISMASLSGFPTFGTGVNAEWTFTFDRGVQVLERATKGDKRYAMAAQVVAAKLNLLGLWATYKTGTGSVVTPFQDVVRWIQKADFWLQSYNFETSATKVTSWSSPAGWTGTETPLQIHEYLDYFNNYGIDGVFGHMD